MLKKAVEVFDENADPASLVGVNVGFQRIRRIPRRAILWAL